MHIINTINIIKIHHIASLLLNIKKQNDQHLDFTASHLHHYYLSSTTLDFRVRMGSGMLDVIWQIVITILILHIDTTHPIIANNITSTINSLIPSQHTKQQTTNQHNFNHEFYHTKSIQQQQHTHEL